MNKESYTIIHTDMFNLLLWKENKFKRKRQSFQRSHKVINKWNLQVRLSFVPRKLNEE